MLDNIINIEMISFTNVLSINSPSVISISEELARECAYMLRVIQFYE